MPPILRINPYTGQFDVYGSGGSPSGPYDVLSSYFTISSQNVLDGYIDIGFAPTTIVSVHYNGQELYKTLDWDFVGTRLVLYPNWLLEDQLIVVKYIL